MGKITLEGVQTLLHLNVPYTYFPTWNETLKFEVDGVLVTAIATHAWRYESVKVIEPFEVEGGAYGQSRYPPFFGLGFFMSKLRNELAEKGLTISDESIRMATIVYRRHTTYLHNKVAIDSAQAIYFSKYREEFESLKAGNDYVQARIAKDKSVLRKQLKMDQIGQKEYQLSLKKLKNESWDFRRPYDGMEREIEVGLQEIKRSMIDELLAQEK